MGKQIRSNNEERELLVSARFGFEISHSFPKMLMFIDCLLFLILNMKFKLLRKQNYVTLNKTNNAKVLS